MVPSLHLVATIPDSKSARWGCCQFLTSPTFILAVGVPNGAGAAIWEQSSLSRVRATPSIVRFAIARTTSVSENSRRSYRNLCD